MTKARTRLLGTLAAAAAATLLLAGCVAGEGADGAPAGGSSASAEGLTIDYATYNPLSLIIKEKGWLEDDLAASGVSVTWVQSAGSNKANEALRTSSIDVGSTAGSAALLNRANGSPIQAITIANKPEWSALVVGGDSPLSSVADLRGMRIAATQGTDPYFFLLQALEEAGLSASDVTIENLQHADGWSALQSGSVDAWAGLDPIMGTAIESGARFLYRNVDFNSFDVVAATESLISDRPEVAQAVANAYADARVWALAHPEETAEILATAGGLDAAVAQQVIAERTNFDIDPAPGEAQASVLRVIGPIFVSIGDVTAQSSVDEALDTLLNDRFASAATTRDRS